VNIVAGAAVLLFVVPVVWLVLGLIVFCGLGFGFWRRVWGLCLGSFSAGSGVGGCVRMLVGLCSHEGLVEGRAAELGRDGVWGLWIWLLEIGW